MLRIPPLETERLVIRPFMMEDLDAVHQILDNGIFPLGLYATEAAQTLIDYAFTRLRLKRIVATTTYDNEASIGVMRKVGMHIEKNPYSDPPWFQVVGILENRRTDAY